ncbi:MAG: cache domain-containing protein, partial [Desulfobacteraceae bacterium]|nr:cache domain-containing protein [Desulfobacteraceae bacterium]
MNLAGSMARPRIIRTEDTIMEIDKANPEEHQPRARSLVVVVMLVAGIPLMLIGFLVVQQFGDAYRNKITDHLSVLVRKHSRTIDSFLNDRLGDIRVLARTHPIEQLAEQAFMTRKLAILREEYGGVFVDLGLIDPEGVQVAYSGPFNLAGADYSNALWFSETQKSFYYISDVFTGLRGTPHFIVATRMPWNEKGWILRATVDFNAFNALVSNIRIGTTGFAFIINRAGEFQTNPQNQVARAVGPYQGILQTRLDIDEVRIEEHPDALGHESIFAVTSLNKGRWFLIFQQETKDAFSTWNATKAVAILLFLLWALVVASFTYIVSRKMTLRVEEALIQKEKMSNQVVEAGRLASIGELAAGIAHEINNPVAIMVEEAGWIQDLLAEEEPASDENLGEIKRASAQIRTQGARCKEITHKLLSFARKTDPTIKEIDINEMVTDMITLVDQKTRYASVQVDTDLEAGLPPVMASATELQQVLLNLLNNSVAAMNASGGRIHITTRSENGQVVVKVADNGCGIAEANLARIFDPFFTTK